MDIDGALKTKIGFRSSSTRSNDAFCVGVVHHQERSISIFERCQFRQPAKVAIHTENAVCNNEFDSCLIAGVGSQLLFQVRHIIMTIDDDLGAADPAAIDDAGMVQLITENKVTFFEKCVEGA